MSYQEELRQHFVEAEAKHNQKLLDDPAYRARYEREVAEGQERERQRLEGIRQARSKELVRMGIRPAMAFMLMAGVQAETKALVAARGFEAQRQRSVLVLAGTPGLGKSTAMGWLLLEHLRRRDQSIEESRTARDPYLPILGMPHMVTAAALSRVDRYDADAMSNLFESPLLCIDDVGAEHIDKAGWFLAFFDELINARYSADHRTVISTNLSARSLVERYGTRIGDRLAEVGLVHELRGKSLRGAAPQMSAQAGEVAAPDSSSPTPRSSTGTPTSQGARSMTVPSTRPKAKA